MLCDWRRDADDVRFLERVLSNIRVRDLSRDADERHGIDVRRRDARDEVPRARARRRKDDADLARRAGIAVGRMDRALLVPRQHMRKFHLVDCIIQRQHRAARIAEHDIDALFFQALEDCLRAIHQQSCCLLFHW